MTEVALDTATSLTEVSSWCERAGDRHGPARGPGAANSFEQTISWHRLGGRGIKCHLHDHVPGGEVTGSASHPTPACATERRLREFLKLTLSAARTPVTSPSRDRYANLFLTSKLGGPPAGGAAERLAASGRGGPRTLPFSPPDLPPSVKTFCGRHGLLDHVGAAVRLAAAEFGGQAVKSISLDRDPDFQDEWVTVSVLTDLPPAEAVAARRRYTSQWVLAAPAPQRHMVRLSLAVA